MSRSVRMPKSAVVLQHDDVTDVVALHDPGGVQTEALGEMAQGFGVMTSRML